jgi:hypothetical protein
MSARMAPRAETRVLNLPAEADIAGRRQRKRRKT